MMKGWKLRLFVRGIRLRMKDEGITVDEALACYPKLTDEEKAEIKKAIEDGLVC